ncbi:MAG: zinc-ribbon domain-containing protein [Candidatus Hodarchaeales archaeon]
MQCVNCGTSNPEGAQFCFECGKGFPKPAKIEYFKPSVSNYCLKCGVSNPKDSRFCLECGTPLEEAAQPQPRLCPTCGITIDHSRLFCPNCGQSLTEKPLEKKKKAVTVPSLETRTECPACGQLTTGDYCRNCGYNLSIRQRKRPIDWWYCDRDSAILTEIDPNLQIPVSRKSLDESLAQAMDNNILQHQDRENARSLALQLFESSVTTNFEVLSQVRCPVCGHQSLAPTTQRPRKLGISYSREIALTVGAILQNGIFYFRTYPQLLLIILCAIVIDIGLVLLGLSTNSILNSMSPIAALGIPFTGFLGSYSFVNLIFIFVISFVINNFFQCWYYTSLKEISRNKDSPFNIGESFKNSFRFLPRVVLAQFTIVGILIGMFIGFILVFIVLSGLMINMGDLNQTFYYFLMFFLGGILLVLAFVALFTILFSYVSMSIIFDDDSGVILSLKRSWRFARRYFWTTVGIILIFIFLLYAISYIQNIFSYPFYFISSLIVLLISNISTRLVEAYKSISLGWAYDEFKHTIDSER